MARAIGLLLALLIGAGVGLIGPTRAAPELEPELAEALTQLLEPIVACIDNADTDNAAFHGCFDWHSAVHANLALRIAGRLRAEPGLQLSADRVASVEAIAAEHLQLSGGELDEELPYGYAWLLLLDVEAGRTDIHAIAADAAGEVQAWLADNLVSEQRALGRRYAGSAFPAFALQRWYRRFEPELAASFGGLAAPVLVGHADAACAAPPDTRGFLDPCAALLLALAEVAHVSAAVPRPLLEEMAATVGARAIVRSEDLSTIFGAGLNFSRAWALYLTARVLNDSGLIARADRLFHAQVAQPEIWREGYDQYSHWVAQFGVFALALRAEATDLVPLPSPPPGPTPTRFPPIPLPPVPVGARPEPEPIAASGARWVAPSVWEF